MDQERAEEIFWVLVAGWASFDQHYDSPNHEKYKKEREKISKRYRELKGTHSFLDAERISAIEWLISSAVEQRPVKSLVDGSNPS